MEVKMSKVKRTMTTNLLVVVGLVILSIMLAACGTDSEAAAPVGLRAEAINDLVAQEVDEADQVSEPAPDAATDAIVEQASETDIGVATTTVTTNNGNGQARAANGSAHNIDPSILAEATADEIAGLVYMREEEKLARDVYLALYEQWGQPIFQNIAASEQAHMDSVLMLLDQVGVSDPAADKGQGEFNDPVFQSLYDDLVAQGSLSQIEALRVGATIEELDIVDLQERLAQTNDEAIVQVYSNLLAGSENHLRSFVSNLERQGGGPYQPAHLGQAAYEAIIAGANGNGNGYRGGNSASGGSSSGGGYGSSGGNGNGRQNGRNNNNA
jgi:hypothetical protein